MHFSPGTQITSSIDAIVQKLQDSLSAQGYALLESDIQSVVFDEVHYYASRCAVLEYQRTATQAFELNGDVTLTGDEWAIIEPCVRAHCDLKQARLMEGSASLNGSTFSIGVSEAINLYNDKRLAMFQDAFIEPPFSFQTLSEKGD